MSERVVMFRWPFYPARPAFHALSKRSGWTRCGHPLNEMTTTLEREQVNPNARPCVKCYGCSDSNTGREP